MGTPFHSHSNDSEAFLLTARVCVGGPADLTILPKLLPPLQQLFKEEAPVEEEPAPTMLS